MHQMPKAKPPTLGTEYCRAPNLRPIFPASLLSGLDVFACLDERAIAAGEMPTPRSRLKRRRHGVDIFAVKDGERNAVGSGAMFISQGHRLMEASRREQEEKRERVARAAERRLAKRKAERRYAMAACDDIVVISSDDDNEESPKRVRPLRRAEKLSHGVIPVQNNPFFSNPSTRTTSRELPKKGTGKLSGMKSRQDSGKSTSRSPLKDITKQGRRVSNPSPKRKKSAFSSLSNITKPWLTDVLQSNLDEQRRKRGLNRFNISPRSRTIVCVDLNDDEEHASSETLEPSRAQLSVPDYNHVLQTSSLSTVTPSVESTPAIEKKVVNVRLEGLSAGEKALVKSLTFRVANRDVMAVVKCAKIKLRGEDFNCLRGCRWLNDEIINSFAALINERNKTFFAGQCPRSGSSAGLKDFWDESLLPRHNDTDTTALFQRKRPRAYMFNTFFYTRLATKGYDYEGVKRWPKRAGINVMELDIILFPVNLNNFHWVLVFVDLRSKQFVYCDSLYGHDQNDVLKTLRRWLVDEVTQKSNEDTATMMDIANWPCIENPSYLPMQTDAGSCGVFALYTADYLEVGKKPDFTQDDICLLRQRTAIYLKRERLPLS